MKRSTYASSVLTALLVTACGAGDDGAADANAAAKPGGQTKRKAPWNEQLTPSPEDHFVVEDPVLSPEEAAAAAAEEITAENADDEFEKLKRAIQDG